MAHPPFHGFFYTQKEDRLCGLRLDARQAKAFAGIHDGAFDVVPHEVYWKKLARYMVTHAPQGYVAWNGIAHWLIGNCDRLLGDNPRGELGINVIQFTPDRAITYQWFTQGRTEHDETWDPTYDLVFTPWDWNLEGEGDDEMFPLSKAQIAGLKACISWTDELHAELERRWPSDTHWS